MSKSHYEKFLTTTSGQMAKSLLVRHRLSLQDMFDVIHAIVEAEIPSLIPEKAYTTEELVGPALWAEWPYVGMTRPAGMCLKYLVLEGILPLELCNTPDDSSIKRYRLSLKQVVVAV